MTSGRKMHGSWKAGPSNGRQQQQPSCPRIPNDIGVGLEDASQHSGSRGGRRHLTETRGDCSGSSSEAALEAGTAGGGDSPSLLDDLQTLFLVKVHGAGPSPPWMGMGIGALHICTAAVFRGGTSSATGSQRGRLATGAKRPLQNVLWAGPCSQVESAMAGGADPPAQPVVQHTHARQQPFQQRTHRLEARPSGAAEPSPSASASGSSPLSSSPSSFSELRGRDSAHRLYSCEQPYSRFSILVV